MIKTKTKPAAKRRSKTQAMRDVARPITIPAAPWTQRLELAPGVVLYQGDCVAVMAALEAESVHAVVTDPPYELGFMGKAWDAAGGVASRPETWARALDALKPGGHLVAFAGSRTYHRIACAIEDAGFDIRDQLMWLYGSGFPKSHDVAKCIDKAGGVWRGRAGAAKPTDTRRALGQHFVCSPKGEAVFDDARTWDGWGTALKPAHEPIALARKPLGGTVMHNVLTHRTGAINVKGCTIGDEARTNGPTSTTANRVAMNEWRHAGQSHDVTGRWPANVMHDGSLDVFEALPPGHRDAFRFFYSPKADKADREFGLADVAPEKMAARTAHDRDRDRLNRNFHPTVKPVDLMRWLVRLITPPGGVVLEPFMGSGSTGIAAVREGARFIGIEQSPEYFDIARRRIAAAIDEHAATPTLFVPPRVPRAEQMTMFH